MINHPGYASFRQNRVTGMATELGAILAPVMNQFCAREVADRDLYIICEHSWDLSAKILSTSLNFDFRYPDCGARFAANSMSSIWPDIPAGDVQAAHWRVALVVSPVITVRADRGGNVSVRTLTKADTVNMQ
jgi:hypothetical protein